MAPLISIVLVSVALLVVQTASADDTLRPLYHFTAERGWINDPNGLVFDGSQYHLFFQHYTGGLHSIADQLTWGHAVSDDLLAWKQLPEAVEPFVLPDGNSAGAWSGTAVIDHGNTSGFGSAQNPAMVLFWTATHFGQCLAYSTDGGRTFTRYAANPIIPKPPEQQGDWDRDPDVFWYEPARHWVLIYSISGKGFVVNTSDDLKHWTRHGIVEGFFECPNCFELPVDGDPNHRRWVLWDASSKYRIGLFDGTAFQWDTTPRKLDLGKNYYAAQTWANVPGGRRIGIGWMNGGSFPGQPFNQQLGIPSEISIKTFPGTGMQLVKYPVAEVEHLRYGEKRFSDLLVKADSDTPLPDVRGETLDIDAQIDRPAGATFKLTTCGQEIVWNDDSLSVGGATAELKGLSTFRLRILIDRASLEVYADGGRVSFTNALDPDGKDKGISLSAAGGDVRIRSLSAWRVRSPGR